MRRRVGSGHSRRGTAWFLAGYAGVAGFFALEAATRQRGRASSLEASNEDRGTTRMILGAYAAAALLAPVLRRAPAPRLPRGAGAAGIAVEAAGLGLRAWSMRTLGDSYTRTLRAETDQSVIESGPYQLVRHPGYAGSLLVWTGFALTSRSVPVIAAVGALLGTAYRRRILAEEMLLRRELPGYAAYCERTRRLIPFVW